MIREAGLYNKISQAYAGIDTNKAVGVMVCYVVTPILAVTNCVAGRCSLRRIHCHLAVRIHHIASFQTPVLTLPIVLLSPPTS